MPLYPNSKQKKGKTIESFYIDFADNNGNVVNINISNNMLAFIKMMNETFKETEIWGLTSHYHLILQTQDKWDSDWHITVYCIGNHEYYIEYLLPESKRPWPYATVKGVAQSLSEAKKYLLIAMKETQVWPLNDELSKLFLEIK